MNLQLKNYLKILTTMFLTIIISIFIATSLYYFNIINSFFNTLISFFGISIAFFIAGYKQSSITTSKKYLNGAKPAFGMLFLIIIFNAIFNNTIFSLSYLVYYLILISFSIIGFIIRTNNKEVD